MIRVSSLSVQRSKNSISDWHILLSFFIFCVIIKFMWTLYLANNYFYLDECNKSSDSYCNPNSVAINNSNPNDKTRTRVIELKRSGQHRQELVFICRRNEIYNVIGNNATLIVSQQLYRRPIKVVCDKSSGQWFEYNSKTVVIGFYCGKNNILKLLFDQNCVLAMVNSSSSTTTSPSTTTQLHSSHCRKFSNCHKCVNHVGCK